MRWLTGGMTLHLAHHLRPVAPRRELPVLHETTVAKIVEASGLPLVEYPSFSSAVAGLYRRLRDLGSPESEAAAAPAWSRSVTAA
jgi:fatty acid desaturase